MNWIKKNWLWILFFGTLMLHFFKKEKRYDDKTKKYLADIKRIDKRIAETKAKKSKYRNSSRADNIRGIRKLLN
jgi:hypothetical protein